MTTWTDVKNAIHFWNTGDSWGEGRLGIFDAHEKQWIYDTLEEFYETSPTAEYWLNFLTLPGVVGLRIGESAQPEALNGRTSVGFVKDFDLVMVNQAGTLITSQSKYHLIHEILHVIMQVGDNQTPDIFFQNLASYDFFGPVVREEQKIASEMGDLDQIPSAYLMRFPSAEAASFFGWSVNENYTDGQTIKYSRMGSEADDFLDMQLHDPGDPSADLIIGMQGGDEIHGASGNDHLHGDFTNAMGPGGNDRLYGGDGDDRLYGGDGDDLLSGGAGNDIITSGPGSDILWGGDVDADQARPMGSTPPIMLRRAAELSSPLTAPARRQH